MSTNPNTTSSSSESPFRTESSTKMRLLTLSHTWTIDNFTFYTIPCPETPQLASTSTFQRQYEPTVGYSSFSSSKFTSADTVFTFYLNLFPKGDSEPMKDYLAAYLHLDTDTIATSEFDMIYEMSILDGKKKKHATREARSKFIPGRCWGFRNFVHRHYLLENASLFLPNNQLTIFVEIKIIIETKFASRETNDTVQRRIIAERRSMADYRHMYETRKFTDIVLVVGRSGNAHLPVHKAILAARSPVFAAMFEHDTLEKAKNRVVIPDIEEDIAEAMIKFLYYADTTVLEEFACELLLVADKYDLASLKATCIEHLTVNLTVATAADILLYADISNSAYLRGEAVLYIVHHTVDVMATDGWGRLVREKASLVGEILQQLAWISQQPVGNAIAPQQQQPQQQQPQPQPPSRTKRPRVQQPVPHPPATVQPYEEINAMIAAIEVYPV